MAVTDPNISVLVSGRTGTNGATSYTDELGSVFAASGAAAMSTTSPPYGAAAMQITGSGTGDYWSTPATTPWVLGGGDFCVEVWVDQTSGEAIYLDNSGQNGNAGWRIGLWDAGSKQIYWYSDVGGFFSFGVTNPTGAGPRYFRFERIGGTVSVYDGTSRVGQYTDATDYNIAAPAAYVGRANNDFSFRPFTGKIYAQITKNGNRGGGGAPTLPAVPSPLAFIAPAAQPFEQQTTSVGGTATFAPGFIGSPTSYQWKRNGANIGGATGASYTTGALTEADNGAFYSVVATNGSGSGPEVGAYLFIRDVLTGQGRNMRSWPAHRRQGARPTSLLLPRAPLVDGGDSGAAAWQDWLALSIPTTNQYTLAVDPAAYAVAAAPVAAVRASGLAVDPAAYSVAAADVATGAARAGSVPPLAYTVATAPITIQRQAQVAPAAYAVAAPVVTTQADRAATVPPVAYTITPAPVTVFGNAPGSVDPAAYAVAAAPVTGSLNRVAAVPPVAYVVAPAAVSTPSARVAAVPPVSYTVSLFDVLVGLARSVPVDPVVYTVERAPVGAGRARVDAVGPAVYDISAPPVGASSVFGVAVDPAAYGIEWPEVTGDQGVEPTRWVFTTLRAEDRRATIPAERRQSTIASEVRRWSITP